MNLSDSIKFLSKSKYQKEIGGLSPQQLHNVISEAVMTEITPDWQSSEQEHNKKRRAYYFSAEFLIGRLIYNNLMCCGLTEQVRELLAKEGADLNSMEEIEDAALGNGGLGRLAACFLDSAATLSLPLDGYGIRYKFGLFKQSIENGFQTEEVDDWTKSGDPWSRRTEEDEVTVELGYQTVRAVPYDIPVIGYNTKNISTLRLWQCEPMESFDFEQFNEQKYAKALEEKNTAENISRVLYPNDSTNAGKILRLSQQYFLSSASLQDIIKKFKSEHGGNLTALGEYVVIQLNDTHPVISIPELIRLLMAEGHSFDDSFDIANDVFCYTNHTVMQEALEKWDMKIIKKVCPAVAKIIVQINAKLKKELKKYDELNADNMLIIQKGTVHMAYLACYCSHYINGVAKIHTNILRTDVLKDWFEFSPEKFQNKTNGITQRRWLKLCNPELSKLITELLESDEWITNLDMLKDLEKYADDKAVLERFVSIKQANKEKLSEYIRQHDGIVVDAQSSFDVQIKRLHEYKRQLLNILTILELYFEIKEGTIKNFMPTTFIFGAKSAPGYFRAKAIIKLINEVGKLIENDRDVSKYIKVVFVSNYNVSYAEKIIAAANVSEQISTAGTEASGTGNMKLMLNGAVTLGTYDGANIEIVERAGAENNYIFGARVEDIDSVRESYSPKQIYANDSKVRRVLDALIDGTLDDGGTGMFRELYSSILEGASWHTPDHYYLLLDFNDYLSARIRLNHDQQNRIEFAKKCWLNMCNAGFFSSDRTIKEYADEIWKIG